MKRIILHISYLCIVAVIGTAVAVGGGFQLNEHGARAMAQGGAFAARAYDASAMYFNPAGLGFQTGRSFYLGTTLIMPKSSFFGPVQNNTNEENKMVDQTFTPINLYGTYQIDDRIHVGIGVNNPYGLGTEWDENWPGKFITTKIDLMSFFISPTIAYKINDQLSVGAGFNYVTGTVKINRIVSDPFDPHAKVTLDLSGTGYGYTAGAIYKITKEISVGASYRSSVKLDAKGTANFDPARTTYPKGDASASIELPATAFVGVAYKPIENLEVEADYQYIGWSSYKELTIEFKADPTKNTTAPKNFRDTYILRLGGEYTMGDFQFRAGYLQDRTPVKGPYVDPTLPDANRNGVNLGVGYKINEMFSVDVAYMYLKFDQRKVVNTVVNFDGTYNQSANLIGIDLLIHY